MDDETAYDRGYASVEARRSVGANTFHVAPDAGMWGGATIKLHLGWLAAQLRSNPRDQFRWGRYDALCDLLAATDGHLARTLDQSALRDLQGLWWKEG